MVGAGDPQATYRAGRATLCAGPDDLVRYAHVFEAWFGVREKLPRTLPGTGRVRSARRCRWGIPASEAARVSPTSSTPPRATSRCSGTATWHSSSPTRRPCWTR